MANAITNLENEILANQIFGEFLALLTPLSAFGRNFSAEAARRGAKIKVPFVGAQDAAVDFAGTYVMQDADVEGKDIVLSGHKYVSWGITDKELFDNGQLNIEMFAANKASNLAKAVLQDIWSLITIANFSNEIEVTTGNFDSDEMADLQEDCTILNWPEVNRNAILAPAAYTGLLKDAGIQSSDAFGGSEAIREAKIPRLFGFNVMQSNYIPSNSQNLHSFVAYPDAIFTGMRYLAPDPDHNYSVAMPLTDEKTGITLGWKKWYDPDTSTTRNVIECLYGKLTGNGNSLIRIQTPG
jgi:hypothetical protein